MADATGKREGAIDEELLELVYRRASRRIAAVWVHLMAETDTSIAQIAHRLGVSKKEIKKQIDLWMDGKGSDLDWASNICWAMGAELIFTTEDMPLPTPPKGEGE